MNAPISMNMTMHMFGFMYAPSNQLTIMMMGNYSEKEMTKQRMKMSGSAKFDVNSSGVGDTTLSFFVRNKYKKNVKDHFGVGLSFPSGSTDCRDSTPVSSNSRLGYAMQNGSGTFDVFFMYNNLNIFNRFKIGEQIYFKTPVSGRNSKSYKYGNTFNSSVWASYRWIDNISTSIKMNYNYRGYMKGSDNEMDPRMSPAMDSRNSGHQKFSISFGVNFVNYKKKLSNHRIGFEANLPVFQKYRGLQLGEKFRLIFGWQFGV